MIDALAVLLVLAVVAAGAALVLSEPEPAPEPLVERLREELTAVADDYDIGLETYTPEELYGRKTAG